MSQCLWRLMVELLNCKSVTGKRACAHGQPAWTMLPARHVVTNMSAYMNYLTGTCMNSHYPYPSCPTAIPSVEWRYIQITPPLQNLAVAETRADQLVLVMLVTARVLPLFESRLLVIDSSEYKLFVIEVMHVTR